MTLREILKQETAMMGRPAKPIESERLTFRDAQGVRRELYLVIYDASSETQDQTRWAVYIDGKAATSGIVSVEPHR
jgi:hypothetical protein